MKQNVKNTLTKIKKQNELINTENTLYSKTRKEQKGITLIALVITIIVLLILAGVAIATLLGDNGIITKATTAKEKTQQAGAVERVQMEVQGSYGTDGNIDVTELSKNLGNISGIDGLPISTLPATVTLEGYDVTIKKDGTVTAFNRKEWDKTATPPDCFIWGSDVEGEEGYNVVVAYKQKIEEYSKLKFPSRCEMIEIGSTYTNSVSYDGRSYCSSIEIIELPNTVKKIGNWAFSSGGKAFSKLRDVKISDSVTSIGTQAFLYCKNLTSITIPNSVTSIGDWAFGNCDGLTKITIPDSVTSIGDNAFYKCTGLTNITISNGVTSIGDYAFGSCYGLTKITIPDSVTSIGDGAFSGCTGLTEITIPNSVTNIGSYAFSSISDNAVFHVVKGSYAEEWVNSNKYGSQTIEYITE